MKLYEIKQAYLDFLTAVDNGDIDDEQAIKDTLENIDSEFNTKIDNIACLIKNLSADEKALAIEIKALQERKQAKTAMITRLKSSVYDAMLAIGTRRVDTARVLITIAKNPKSVEIADEKQFKEWAIANAPEYLTMREPDISKTAVKLAIESGVEINGASIVQKEGVRIK